MDSLRTILDTSVVIGNRLDEIDGELAISAITLAKLHFGVLVASDLQARALRLQRLIAVERRFEPLAVDARVAGSFGNLASVVRSTGRRPRARALDLMIAATAHAHGARLLTRNPSDFQGIDHLVQIDTPPDAS
ncbi:type II toxin-antitoxin system VapC family toxin [Rhodococcus sp. BP-149]|uniref:type II toxin-antitoxin system VapC family toxin n=1 Tax=unclassified Rhodococcus (in: high G+C Gram-positive bacteria) TaxID=192944 RepID=UPI001D74C365|nr:MULTISPECIES: type II toxin-antitoxin system VapC family toxin [unclassified Rhodococcus (in: high G+C Gram-positive bacteria)]MBY6687245.1 type II toxin-antitoxin system VapC family toxin [Rhodococcus sp. BP-288]MBY6694332.1 type II toxin-antitoxin system VapC family toxin [Rhodococcus sp. BP-188]MBY6698041.1 type II toxin-antitoxin system VapC family toxin [Rhodococcus sp. BP-285]MBY6704261.1 type II toxin-antitoxin system VapC family toxin [Rhodococcus sp. BP-283]MBY6712910.1 type II tox